MKLYISGYNDATKPSIGIYDIGNGCNIGQCWAGFVENSSYLSIYGDYLFGISELEGNSYVHMFKKTGQGYSHLDQKEIKGGSLCHISYLPKNKVLAGACYESGDIFTIRVGVKENEDRFGEIVSFIKQGESEGENGGKVTRAHCVVPNQSETLLYSANIALDKIYCYKVREGELLEEDQLQLPAGEGPRHILLSPNEDILYVITEYSNKIYLLHSTDGKMTLMDCVSTLPENFSGERESYGSSICMTANGRWIYAANRGANTIAVFNVLKNGEIRKIGDCYCFGDWPRHISLVNHDSELAIANQRSNQVVLSKLDAETGFLTEDKLIIDFDQVSYVSEVL